MDTTEIKDLEKEYSILFPNCHLPFGKGSPRTIARQKKRLNLIKERKIYEVNEEFFFHWSDDLAWILGLIWTDGHLSSNTLSITSKDLEMLEKINILTENKRPLKKRKNEAWDYVVSNKKVSKKLRQLGLIEGKEGKTYKICFPEIPKENKGAFVRGLIDGDGCIQITKITRRTKGLSVSLCGASEIYRGVQEWLNENSIEHRIYQSKKNMWNICIFKYESLVALYDLLYPSDNVNCLLRKREVYDKWLNQHKQYVESLGTFKNPKCKYCGEKTYFSYKRKNGNIKYTCRSCKKCTTIKSPNLLNELSKRPACPDCEYNDVIKAGRENGTQCYRCKKCNRRFQEGSKKKNHNDKNKVTKTDRALQKYSEEIQQKCIQMYLKNISIAKISKTMNINTLTLRKWLKKAMIPTRANGYPKDTKSYLLSKCLELRKEGASYAEIGRKLGLGASTVERWIKQRD